MARGVHGRSGPPPDPNALRRERDGDTWVTLPAEGREGESPDWPLENQTDRERVLWEREWARPQAIMWEQNRQETEVAMYVRSFAAAELLNATVTARTLIRQQQEALGLSLPGLARNHWKIAGPPAEIGEQRQAPSARGRFQVVDGGAAS